MFQIDTNQLIATLMLSEIGEEDNEVLGKALPFVTWVVQGASNIFQNNSGKLGDEAASIFLLGCQPWLIQSQVKIGASDPVIDAQIGAVNVLLSRVKDGLLSFSLLVADQFLEDIGGVEAFAELTEGVEDNQERLDAMKPHLDAAMQKVAQKFGFTFGTD